jgi:conjugal transfer/entry exclusion protein
MNDQEFSKAVERLQEVNKVVSGLDPAIRAQAFAVLSRYVAGTPDGTLDELGETESLRLQMAMDSLSKLMETLANIMHRISDTQAALAKNLK